MTLAYRRAKTYLSSLLQQYGVEAFGRRIRPDRSQTPPHVPGRDDPSMAAVKERWAMLGADDSAQAALLDDWTAEHLSAYAHNVEHLIGTVKVPIGLAGPLRVNGLFAKGNYYVPLATTEASLVASYSRGAVLITQAGGASTMLLNEGVSRAPVLVFDSLEQVGRFVHWMSGHLDAIETAANATTRFGKLQDVEASVEGTKVYLLFDFSTGDAAGQNMVTIATFAALAWINEHTPVKPRASYLEGNFSGDKKASARSFQRVRGKKAVAEVVLPGELVRRSMHTTPERMVDCARIGTVGAVMSGTLGSQGHYANGLTALFLACGQDVACVSEAAVGITDLEVTAAGDLHACVTLPNLIVGTLGGGTGLPSQRASLDLMNLSGAGHARAFAEVAAALCLAGELSLIGAIAAGEFAASHARLARAREL